MTEEESKAKCDAIRQIAYELHVYLGAGYLEKILRKSMKTVLPTGFQRLVSMFRHKCQLGCAMKMAMFLEITLLTCL